MCRELCQFFATRGHIVHISIGGTLYRARIARAEVVLPERDVLGVVETGSSVYWQTGNC